MKKLLLTLQSYLNTVVTSSFITAISFIIVSSFCNSLFAQNAGINASGATPDLSAILDLNTGNAGQNKGFLPPQVALTSVSTEAPVTNPATGLVVYSTSAPTGGNGTGYYYWDGSQWDAMSGFPSGAGITNYVAVWNSPLTLGTGLIQDNGSNVGINSVPSSNIMLNVVGNSGDAVYGTTNASGFYGIHGYNSLGTAIYGNGITYGVTGQGSTGGAYFNDHNNDTSYLAFKNYGIYAKGNLAGGYLSDNAGLDYASIGDFTYGYGVNAKGNTGGGYFTDGTDNATVGDITNGTGITGYGSNSGAYFADIDTFNYAYLGNATLSEGIYANGASYGGYFQGPNSNYAYAGDGVGGNGINAYGSNNGGYFNNKGNAYAYISSGTQGGVFYDSTGNNFTQAGDGMDGAGAYCHDSSGDYCYLANGPSVAGGYFEDALGDYAYIAYNGNAIYSTGAKNTIVQDKNGKYRGMTCTESPEILFQDYGTSQLLNGKAHINLDKLFAHTVTINKQHPLRVMVTLNDECNGVFVTNRTSTGFDVVELNHGTSNASFTYEVVANRSDYTNYKGITRHYADVRYPDAPGPLPKSKYVSVKNTGKTKPSLIGNNKVRQSSLINHSKLKPMNLNHPSQN